MDALKEYLKNSYTAYHAVENAKAILEEQGFKRLYETDDWALCEDGKYYVERDGSSLIAFTIGAMDEFSYKIVASHTDSPALKIKENPETGASPYVSLNVEPYGGGVWYSFLDRPLKIAGRIIRNENGALRSETYTSPFQVSIPSVAVHMNRGVNEGFAVNPQVDLLPLFALKQSGATLESIMENESGYAVAFDLFLSPATEPYTFGVNDEFLAAPRIDNLTSVFASVSALLSHGDGNGVCIAALFDNEETGSLTSKGADGDFLETILRRIAYSFRFDDNEYYKALANSFMLSVDNAHAVHPNHPEHSDPTNKTTMGGGVVLKHHANRAYTTDASSAAIVKTLCEKADVACQPFFNRSNARSGSTLGAASLRHVSMRAADIGIAQLAMHSACECFACKDYEDMLKLLQTFYSTELAFVKDDILIR